MPGATSPPLRASEVRYLIDAGPLVGAFWAADQWHEWSRQTLTSLGSPVYTTETVLAEAAHLLKQNVPTLLQLLAAVDAGLVRLMPVYPMQIGRAAEIISEYESRGDLGDASLIILSEQFPRARLVTLDRADFSIYRRRDGRPIPCLLPPARD